ncbi:MAG: glycine-rich protein, partial [Bacteroidota bacterium]
MKSTPRKGKDLHLVPSNQLRTKTQQQWLQFGLIALFTSILFFSIQQTGSISASSYPIADDQDQDNIPNWEDVDDDNDGIPDQWECNPDQIEVFTYTGSDQITTIPSGAETIKAKIWGAGGRGDQRSGRGTGGAGGYTEIEIPISALPGGTTQLIVTVGEGGSSSTDSSTYGNGGAGFVNTSGSSHDGRNAGSGGGMSALSLVSLAVPASVSVDDLIAIAGGGGTMPAYSSGGTYAGEGGGTNGGDEKSHPTQGGGGGSQTAGGAAINNGNPGSFLQGGNAVNNGGGGGGGFYGGASGNFADPCGTCTSSADEHGGGGGSGYVNPSATSSNMQTGSLQTPPNTTDSDYVAGVGLGGNAGSGGGSGGNGLVVITYVFPLDCDFDKDGLPNHLDLDSDGDGITDII